MAIGVVCCMHVCVSKHIETLQLVAHVAHETCSCGGFIVCVGRAGVHVGRHA